MKPISLLLVGKPGSGKSYLASTAPKPMIVFNWDLDAVATYEGIEDAEIVSYGSDVQDLSKFSKRLDLLHKEFKNCVSNDSDLPATIVCDSMTGLTELLIQAQLTLNKGYESGKSITRRSLFGEGVVPTLDDWNVIISYLKPLIQKFLAIPCHKIVTAHDMSITNNKGDILEVIPSVPGKNKFARSIASMFTGAGYCERNNVNRRWEVRFGGLRMVDWTLFRNVNVNDKQFDTVENTWRGMEKMFKEAGLMGEEK